MAERTIALVLKTNGPLRVPGVRIPLLPPKESSSNPVVFCMRRGFFYPQRSDRLVVRMGASRWWRADLAQPVHPASLWLFDSAVNSQWLAARLDGQKNTAPLVFSLLNLTGGSFLLVNALIRNEIVWVVLEIYFIVIAVKGLWQLQAKRQEVPVLDLRTQEETTTGSSSPASSPDVTYVLHLTLQEYREWSASAQKSTV